MKDTDSTYHDTLDFLYIITSKHQCSKNESRSQYGTISTTIFYTHITQID